MSLGHEKLRVYQESLRFVQLARALLRDWPGHYAVKDHLSRACDSMLLNLAVGAVQRSSRAKIAKFDVALGSALECAACIDVAHVYRLIAAGAVDSSKQNLSTITGMLVALRRSAEPQVGEDEPDYGVGTGSGAPQVLFYHERLDVYQVALQLVAWLHGLSSAGELPDQLFRELDTTATGIALNIAEGNGRFSTRDHCRFLGFAQDAAVKAATQLDLAALDQTLASQDIEKAKHLLGRIVAMILRMIGPSEYD